MNVRMYIILTGEYMDAVKNEIGIQAPGLSFDAASEAEGRATVASINEDCNGEWVVEKVEYLQ